MIKILVLLLLITTAQIGLAQSDTAQANSFVNPFESSDTEEQFNSYSFYQTQVGLNFLINTNHEFPFGVSADQLFGYRVNETYAIGFGIGTSIYLEGSGLPVYLNNRLYKELKNKAFYGYADVGYDLSFSGPLIGNGIGIEFYTENQKMFTIQIGSRYQKLRDTWYSITNEYLASNLHVLQLKMSLQY